MKPKLWIATELFYPEETSTSFILTKVANRLSKNFDVQVITGSKNSEINSSYFKLADDINVLRFRKISENKNNLILRLASFFYSSLILFYYLALKVRKGDKVLIVTNPAPLIVFISFLRRFKNFELFVLVHDVFPENTIPAGIIKNKSSIKYKIIKKIFNWAYSKVDKIIVLGRDMKDIFEQKSNKLKNKIVIIENWGDTKNIFPNNENIISEKIRIQYAGNIGRVQGLEEFMHIFKDANNQNLRFDLYGDGVIKSKLQNWVTDKKLDNVFFHPAYSRNEQNSILNSCDISIVSLANGMYGLGVPSKTYNILAAGKPILYFGEKNTEIDLLIKEYNIGFSFELKDKSSIAEFLDKLNCNKNLKIMGENSRKLAETMFSEEIILNKFAQLF